MSFNPTGIGFVNVPNPGTPVALSAASLFCPGFRVQPRRNATTVNVGNVYLKDANGNTWAILSPEQVDGKDFALIIDAYDLSKWFVDADNAGDGMLVGYIK